MTADKIPSVLFQPNSNSISMERLMKQAIKLLEQMPSDDGGVLDDEINTVICSLQVVIANLDRS